MRSKVTVMVAVLAAAAFCLPAAGQAVISYDADTNADPGDGTGLTGGGGAAANFAGENAWHSELNGVGVAGFTSTGSFAASNLDTVGFHMKTRLYYVGGNNSNISRAGFYLRTAERGYDIYWNGGGAGGTQEGGLGGFTPADACCPGIPGLAGDTDWRGAYRDYVFSMDPVAQTFDIFVDKVLVSSRPLSDFNANSADLFGFTGNQGGGNGNMEDFYIHSISLNVGPIPEPASMALLSLGGLAMLRRRRA